MKNTSDIIFLFDDDLIIATKAWTACNFTDEEIWAKGKDLSIPRIGELINLTSLCEVFLSNEKNKQMFGEMFWIDEESGFGYINKDPFAVIVTKVSYHLERKKNGIHYSVFVWLGTTDLTC
jgi:hypothetical protein